MSKRANGEGTVYARTNGKGYVGEVILDGKRRRVSGTTKPIAAAKLREMIREHERGALTSDGRVTVRQLVELWQTKYVPAWRDRNGKPYSPSALVRFEWYGNLIVDELGAKLLTKLTTDDIEAFLTKLATRKPPQRPFGRASLVGMRSVLGKIIKFGERRGLVNHNVARVAEIPNCARPEVRRQALDVEQARKLWDVAGDHRLGAMWRLGMMIAARPGELAGLTWESVDLDSDTPSVTLSREVQMRDRRPHLVDGVKTDGSYRSLGIGSLGAELLRAHRTAQAAERLAAKRWANPHLVFANVGGDVLDPANVRRDLARLCAEHELPRVLPNELRHTGSSIMLDAGMSYDRVADIMGHTTTRMLRQRYAHKLRPVLDEHVTSVSAVFGSTS